MILHFALFSLAILVLVVMALHYGVMQGGAIKPVVWQVMKWLVYSVVGLVITIAIVGGLMQLNHL